GAATASRWGYGTVFGFRIGRNYSAKVECGDAERLYRRRLKNQNCSLGVNMKAASYDLELKSLKTILDALEPLDEAQRRFVLKTVTERLGISMTPGFVPANNQVTPPVEEQLAAEGCSMVKLPNSFSKRNCRRK